MNCIYEIPYVDIIRINVDIITESVSVPDFEEDEKELPKQDW